jgi:hypothetical protein
MLHEIFHEIGAWRILNRIFGEPKKKEQATSMHLPGSGLIPLRSISKLFPYSLLM